MAKDDKATSPPGEGRKLTITDIARLAGVSKKTVSRVINHSGLVKAETRDRILKIVAEHAHDLTGTGRGHGCGNRRIGFR